MFTGFMNTLSADDGRVHEPRAYVHSGDSVGIAITSCITLFHMHAWDVGGAGCVTFYVLLRAGMLMHHMRMPCTGGLRQGLQRVTV